MAEDANAESTPSESTPSDRPFILECSWQKQKESFTAFWREYPTAIADYLKERGYLSNQIRLGTDTEEKSSQKDLSVQDAGVLYDALRKQVKELAQKDASFKALRIEDTWGTDHTPPGGCGGTPTPLQLLVHPQDWQVLRQVEIATKGNRDDNRLRDSDLRRLEAFALSLYSDLDDGEWKEYTERVFGEADTDPVCPVIPQPAHFGGDELPGLFAVLSNPGFDDRLEPDAGWLPRAQRAWDSMTEKQRATKPSPQNIDRDRNREAAVIRQVHNLGELMGADALTPLQMEISGEENAPEKSAPDYGSYYCDRINPPGDKPDHLVRRLGAFSDLTDQDKRNALIAQADFLPYQTATTKSAAYGNLDEYVLRRTQLLPSQIELMKLIGAFLLEAEELSAAHLTEGPTMPERLIVFRNRDLFIRVGLWLDTFITGRKKRGGKEGGKEVPDPIGVSFLELLYRHGAFLVDSRRAPFTVKNCARPLAVPADYPRPATQDKSKQSS
ncbi:hypothetical protein ACFSSC_03495 [Corynebacterium mendelii]|uniref:Uncharacterized protein n=1 Tax=Corynebacterium mendelii TaxID=2765362 RepID=A0A939E130_9CORY|nr:hypothetical protein [Corynebacterium mendelii]MBN9643532.1 hypothetical protein [Corynebacterium mendelii]